MDEKLSNIIELDRKYYLNTFGDRTPVCFERGEGIHLYGTDGAEYTDFFAGIAVNALGYGNRAVVDAIKDQSEKLIHCSNLYYIEPQAKLAELICRNSCAERVFFCNSGAEANEGAIKLARIYNKKRFGADTLKTDFICMNHSFHGRTITTATATGQDKYKLPYTPLTPGFRHVDINNFEQLASAADNHTCGIIIEPVQGESGVYPLDREFAAKVRRLCDERDILLIFDEVQTGIGRTGRLFGYEYIGVEPDIFTLAKALGGGVPIGCVCAKGPAASGFAPGEHGTTFGGNPLACAAGFALLSAVIEGKIPEKAAVVGEYLKAGLEKRAEVLGIRQVRAAGLMVGAEFEAPVAAMVKQVLFEKQHYLVGCVGAYTLRILPPLIITEKDCDEFICALTAAYKEAISA